MDAARGFGISLVVYGHTVRGLFGAGLVSRAGGWHFADRFIYAFHMPLFFFLSGLFLRARPEESAWQLVRRHVVRLGYVYVLWSITELTLQIVMTGHTNSSASWNNLWAIFVVPPLQFWFLYTLLLQSVWLGLLDKAGLDRRISLALALVAFVTAPFVPIGNWVVLNHARHSLPFTALGLCLGADSLSAAFRNARLLLAAGVALGFTIVALAVSVATHGLGQVSDLPVSLAGASAAVCLSVLWSRARTGFGGKTLAALVELGRSSLAIYVAHTIVSAGVRIGLHKVLHYDAPLTHTVLGTVLGLVVPVWLRRASVRLNFPYLFEWPIGPRRARAVVADRTPAH